MIKLDSLHAYDSIIGSNFSDEELYDYITYGEDKIDVLILCDDLIMIAYEESNYKLLARLANVADKIMEV